MPDRLRHLWDFDDLGASEQRLLTQLQAESTDDGRAEVLTQLARLSALKDDFAGSEILLVRAESLAEKAGRAAIRIRLERGRARRSSGDAPGALPLFETAFAAAAEAGDAFLAADSAHMAALAAPTHELRVSWARMGIQAAEKSTDAGDLYWRGPIYNNLGVEYADVGDHEAALKAFQLPLEERLRHPDNPQAIQWARVRWPRSSVRSRG